MKQSILVLNAGSSSLKFAVYTADETPTPVAQGEVSGLGGNAKLSTTGPNGRTTSDVPVKGSDHAAAIGAIHDWLSGLLDAPSGIFGVGHRVVHGGAVFTGPVLIDDAVIAALEELVPLAPLHQPHHIAAIRAMAAIAPGVPQVACFDTSFHQTQPALAQRFALPREWHAQGVRRYGFHGLSYEYIASRLPEVAPECAEGAVVVAHLGSGASLCAIFEGRSVATTMGFTPVDGLMMATRSGTLDPGVILYLAQHHRMEAEAIQTLIYEHSGLLGVSGLSGDMRVLLESHEPHAQEAVDLFVYRIGRELGSLAAALGGLDALIFTGGIGEHAAVIRARVCRDAAWLGIAVDEAANTAGGPRISLPGATASAWVIPTDENLIVAHHTRQLLATPSHRGSYDT